MLKHINAPLVGGFLLGKQSLDFVESFQPTTDKNCSYEHGLAVVNAINCQYKPGVLVKLG
jgi:hypothetical protein